MSKLQALYDLREVPLVVGRVASMPVQLAVDTLAADDPLEAAKRFYTCDERARCALAATSPSMARAVDDWIAGKPLRNPKTPLRALSYLLRMATRATPFGLFSGVGVVETGERTTLELDERSPARRTFTRPDMELMCALAAALESGERRERIRFVTNQCAFERGDRLYVTNIALTNYNLEGPVAQAEQREVSLKNTAAVSFVRELCAAATPYGEIVDALCERFEAPHEQGRRLLDRLIEAGVVISELRVSPLGDPVAYLMERFEALDAPFAGAVRAAVDAAARLDELPVAQRRAGDYLEIHHGFGQLVESPPSSALQIDRRAVFAGTLGDAILADAAILADCYARMGRVIGFETFRSRFVARYEGIERMVPLLELVDNNLGLGVPDTTTFEEQDDPERDAAMLRLACEAMRTNAEEVVLDGALRDVVLPPLHDGDAIAPSLEIGFQLAARSREDVENGDYLMVPGLTSDVATRSLGRFAHMLGANFENRMREVARRSIPEGELLAEFAYAPSVSRAYNVSIRPLLFDCEVRAGIGAPPAGDAIGPDDLWVGLQGGRFFLWSKSRERRVNVRETHALMTYTSAPNLCRLLALLHLDGKRVAHVNWGAATNLTYLPRLRYGRVVLSPRRWRFSRAAFGANESDAGRELARLRTVWNMPRYIVVCEEDNRLLLDLDSRVTPALFDDQAPEGMVTIEEALPGPDGAWLRGEDGVHAAEFVAQAVATRRAAAPRIEAPVLLAQRPSYGPGSEWIYAKLYIGAQAADNFIVTALRPLIGELREAGAIDRWFFLRYADGQNHLRVRLHVAQPDGACAVRESLLAAAETWLRESKLVRYALDTYDPEYERYGGVDAVRAAEQFFSYDSDLCAAIIAEGIDDTSARIECAAGSFDELLRGRPEYGQLALEAFEEAAKKKLSPRDRESLRRLSANPLAADASPLEAALRGARRQKRLADLLHMHCNRLGLSGPSEERVGALLRALALARVARAQRPLAASTA